MANAGRKKKYSAWAIGFEILSVFILLWAKQLGNVQDVAKLDYERFSNFRQTLLAFDNKRNELKNNAEESKISMTKDTISAVKALAVDRFYDYVQNNFEMLNILYSIQKFDRVNYGILQYETEYHTTRLLSRQLDSVYAIRKLDMNKAVEFFMESYQIAIEDISIDIGTRKQSMPSIDSSLRRRMEREGQTSDLVYYFGIGLVVLGLLFQLKHALQSD